MTAYPFGAPETFAETDIAAAVCDRPHVPLTSLPAAVPSPVLHDDVADTSCRMSSDAFLREGPVCTNAGIRNTDDDLI